MLSYNLSKTYLGGGYLRYPKRMGMLPEVKRCKATVLKIKKNILKIIYKANRRLRLSISMLMMVIVA